MPDGVARHQSSDHHPPPATATPRRRPRTMEKAPKPLALSTRAAIAASGPAAAPRRARLLLFGLAAAMHLILGARAWAPLPPPAVAPRLLAAACENGGVRALHAHAGGGGESEGGGRDRRRRGGRGGGGGRRRQKGPAVVPSGFTVPSGVVAVHKPQDWTSADVVSRVKAILEKGARLKLAEIEAEEDAAAAAVGAPPVSPEATQTGDSSSERKPRYFAGTVRLWVLFASWSHRCSLLL